MTELLLLIGIILLVYILMQRLTAKLPIPALLGFLLLGMVFGIDGLFRIDFDDYVFAEKLCSVCLVFIMFYGGFGTNFKAAKTVVRKSTVLASLGVVLTALLCGCFIHFVLAQPWLDSFLIGSVIASTDAASVFNILRSRSLNLKDNTASLLEVESGSNDPMSYMLTVAFCALLTGQTVPVAVLLLRQFLFGIVAGVVHKKTIAVLVGSTVNGAGELSEEGVFDGRKNQADHVGRFAEERSGGFIRDETGFFDCAQNAIRFFGVHFGRAVDHAGHGCGGNIG